MGAGASVRPDGHAPVRIVFSDMDDTFLSTDKHVPERNASLLDLLAERGVPFVPCTGRVWPSVTPEVLSHPATRYVVGSDGAAVTEVLHGPEKATRGRRLHLSPLGKRRTLELYQRVRDLDVTYDVFWDGSIYTERKRYELVRTFDMSEYDRQVFLGHRTPFDGPLEELVGRLEDVERVSLYMRGPEERSRVIAAVGEDPTLHYTYSTSHNLEVMDRGTSKGAGLTWLCEHLGIPVACSVGFGDSPNDLSMLAAVGDGVAVANAYPEVRAAAAHVAPWTNDEAAVARYLEPLLGA